MEVSSMQAWLGFGITLFSIVAVIVRVFDTTAKTAKTVVALAEKIDTEEEERKVADQDLRECITNERESRNKEYTKIQIELAKIDTNLVYIRKSIDKG